MRRRRGRTITTKHKLKQQRQGKGTKQVQRRRPTEHAELRKMRWDF